MKKRVLRKLGKIFTHSKPVEKVEKPVEEKPKRTRKVK